MFSNEADIDLSYLLGNVLQKIEGLSLVKKAGRCNRQLALQARHMEAVNEPQFCVTCVLPRLEMNY